jgi:hypothetical protein
MTHEARIMAGVLLLSLVTVESGGLYMVKLVRGTAPATPFQLAFARAGHAHAGVLLILGLVCNFLVDATGLHGGLLWALRVAVPVAALMMPGGFFAASAGKGRTEPNGALALVFAGATVLAVGLAGLGIALIAA